MTNIIALFLGDVIILAIGCLPVSADSYQDCVDQIGGSSVVLPRSKRCIQWFNGAGAASFENALQTCAAKGGELPHIFSRSEHSVLRNFISTVGNFNSAYFGLRKEEAVANDPDKIVLVDGKNGSLGGLSLTYFYDPVNWDADSTYHVDDPNHWCGMMTHLWFGYDLGDVLFSGGNNCNLQRGLMCQFYPATPTLTLFQGQKQFKHLAPVVSTFQATTVMKCAMECGDLPYCFGFNVVSGETALQCELQSQEFNPTNLVGNVSTTYYAAQLTYP